MAFLFWKLFLTKFNDLIFSHSLGVPMLSGVSVLLKLLKVLLFTTLSIAVVLFAISNKHLGLVKLWPLDLYIEVPVYALCLATLGLGFISGFLFSSLKNLPRKYRERQTFKKEIKSLDQQLRQSSIESREGQTEIAKPVIDVAAHNA